MGLTKKSAMGLPELRKRLGGFNAPGLRLRIATNLAEEARTQVANGFRRQGDPYGIPWAPIKRQGMILQLTGRLRASPATQATPAGFRIDMPVAYAAIHQYGGTIVGRSKSTAVVQLGKGKRADSNTQRRQVKVGSGRGAVGGKIAQRQMIPMMSTGGLGPIWTKAFNETAEGILSRYSRGGVA